MLLATNGRIHRTSGKFHDETLCNTVAKPTRYYEK